MTRLHYFRRAFLIAGMALGVFATSAQVNLNSGLVAYYPLNNSATDATGNGNNGTPAGTVTYVNDRFGNPGAAVNFGGTGNPGKITVPHSSTLNFTTGATFAFWVRINSNVGTFGNGSTGAGGYQCMFAKEGDAGGGLWNLARLTGGGMPLDLGVNGMTNLNGTHTPYTTGTWVHYVATMDASGHHVYINGNLITSNIHAANFSAMVNRNLVMGRFNSNWYPMNGSLDDFRVYNRVLNMDEIIALASDDLGEISLNITTGSSYCAGDAAQLTYNATGDYLAANEFTLQMSNGTGSFATPVNVINFTATSGTLNFNIPDGAPSGTGYRFRIVSSHPTATGDTTGVITINGVLGDIPDPGAFRYAGNVSNRNYYRSIAQYTWTNGRTLCTNNGGHLAHIPNATVNDYLFKAAATGRTYIGMHDEITEGFYEWVNGAPVNYVNWFTGEPNNSGNEDYIEIRHDNGQWNDIGAATAREVFLQLNPAGLNQSVCAGANINLSSPALAGATYLWNGPNAFVSNSQNATINNASDLNAGVYTLTLSKGGCTAPGQTTMVSIVPLPLDLGENNTLSPALSTGLVLHYPMNGNANDASGNGNNGTIAGGVTPEIDRFGNANSALRLNGSNGHIQAPNGVYFNGSAFTVSAWVRKVSNTNWARLFDFSQGPGNNNVLLALTNGTTGRPTAEIFQNTSSSGQVVSPVATIANNQWVHVVYTYDDNGGRIYLNGTLVAQNVQTPPLNVVRNICYIGRSAWAGDTYANATMDDFRIYNRLLNMTEIRELFMHQPNNLTAYGLPSSICASGTAQVVLKFSQPGVSYQLRNATTLANVGTAQTGNGDSLIFNVGTLTATTNFEFVATVNGTSCNRVLAPTVTILVHPTPAAPITTGDQVCNSGTLTITASGAGVGENYNWYTVPTGGTPIAGLTGDSHTVGPLIASETYYVSYTDINGCESPRTAVTAQVINPLNPPVDIISGLILHYNFDQQTQDQSGNGYHGTVNGTHSWVNDRNANANSAMNTVSASVPGNNFINCGNPAKVQQLTNQVTISMWIRQTQTWFGSGDGFMPLVNKWDGTGLYTGLYMTNPANMQNRVRWRVNASTFVTSTVNVPVGQWHHIVCTYNGAQLRVYQNGVLTGTANHTGAIANTGLNLQMGRQANGGDITYRGDWDEVKIYNRALNASEIQTLFNNESVAFSTQPLCDGEGNLALTTFNFPGATYQWTGPNGFTSTDQNPPVIPNADSLTYAGLYSLTVTAQGCTSPPQETYVNIYNIPSAPITVNDTVCGSGNAILTAQGAPAGASYRWYTVPTGGTAIAGQTGATLTISNVTSTQVRYVSIVRNGCEGPRSEVTAVFYNPVNTGLTVTGGSACVNSTTVPVNILTTESGVSYQAFSGSTAVSNMVAGGGNIQLDVNVSQLGVGTHSLTIKTTQPFCGDVNLSSQATVTIYALPTVNITPSGPLSFCTGGDVTLTATSAVSYNWSSGESSQSIVVNTTGSYSVSITDANGCSNTSAFVSTTEETVPTPAISANGPTTFCAGGTVQLTASGGTTYQWSTGSTASIINVGATSSITLTAFNGSCSATSVATDITVISAPIVTANASNTSVCPGDAVTLTGGGADSYVWNHGVIDGASFVPSGTLTYTVTGTDANNCSATANVTVTVLTPPNALFTSSAPTICPGSNVTLTAAVSTHTNYDWYLDGSPLQLNGPSAISVNNTGNYELIVVNASGCNNSFNMTIDPGVEPTVSISAANTSFCQGSQESITATFLAGATYQWFLNGSSLGSPILEGNNLNATAAGDYSVTLTNSDGCSGSSNTISMTVIPGPIANIQSAGTSICPGGTVHMFADVVAGATYQWLLNGSPIGGATSPNYDATLAGNYQVVVQNGCSSTSNTIAVTVSNLPGSAGPISGINSHCSGGTGTYSIASVSGATSYLWTVAPAGAASIFSGQGSTSVVVNTTSQNFTLTVVPQNTCGNGNASNLSITVGNGFPCNSQVLFSANNTNICLGNSVVFTNHTNSMFTSGLTAQWNFGTGASPATATGNGPHTVMYNTTGLKTVTLNFVDSFGNVWETLTKTSYINVNPAVSTSPISGTLLVSCTSNSETYTVTPTAGSSYQWNVPAGSVIVSGQGTASVVINFNGNGGNISVIETNSGGCVGAAVFQTISVIDGVNTSPINGASIVACNGSGDVYSVTATTGSTYQWTVPAGATITSGQGTASITVDFNGSFGTVSVVETNSLGCVGQPQDIVVNCTNSMETVSGMRVLVFPNPATTQFEVVVEGMMGNCQLSLFDQTGRLVHSQTVSALSTVNIAPLALGVYTGRIVKGDEVVVFRVVKQ